MNKRKNRRDESWVNRKISRFWEQVSKANSGRGCQIGKPLYRNSVRISWRGR